MPYKDRLLRKSQTFDPGHIRVEKGQSIDSNRVIICGFISLPKNIQDSVIKILKDHSFANYIINDSGDLSAPQHLEYRGKKTSVPIAEIKKIINENSQYKTKTIREKIRDITLDASNKKRKYNIPISFDTIQKTCYKFADFLEKNKEAIAECLQRTECYNAAIDEINRSIDHLRNIHHNQHYFKFKTNAVTSFLPLNQPLYATVCFGLIPSLMSKDVAARPPTDLHDIFRALSAKLPMNLFPNFKYSYESREDFIKNRKQKTDTVIFTGNPKNAQKIRKQFSRDILFILNGAGHNPVVVSKDAPIDKAVDSTLRLCLQNQGQDCAAPNSILVHKNICKIFVKSIKEKLRTEIANKVGPYSDKKNIVGPNTNADYVTNISKVFSQNRKYCTYGGSMNPISGMIEPTIFEKPLNEGGNYLEFFCPAIMIQSYENDTELSKYFEDSKYSPHAMYVTVFGSSNYVNSLIQKDLHNSDNILRNQDLHEVERGFLPYGGLGHNASAIWIAGKYIKGATLPQRDMFEHLIKPSLYSQKQL